MIVSAESPWTHGCYIATFGRVEPDWSFRTTIDGQWVVRGNEPSDIDPNMIVETRPRQSTDVMAPIRVRKRDLPPKARRAVDAYQRARRETGVTERDGGTP